MTEASITDRIDCNPDCLSEDLPKGSPTVNFSTRPPVGLSRLMTVALNVGTFGS